eukprot:SAG11_NODE_7_length_31267_cov_19.541966_14_plen_46_part_00
MRRAEPEGGGEKASAANGKIAHTKQEEKRRNAKLKEGMDRVKGCR